MTSFRWRFASAVRCSLVASAAARIHTWPLKGNGALANSGLASTSFSSFTPRAPRFMKPGTARKVLAAMNFTSSTPAVPCCTGASCTGVSIASALSSCARPSSA